MSRRREGWIILGAILSAVDEESRADGPLRLSRGASRANIAYDRLQTYLVDLTAQGLLTPESPARLTPRGREFLREYRQWMTVLARYGFLTADARAANGDPALELVPLARMG